MGSPCHEVRQMTIARLGRKAQADRGIVISGVGIVKQVLIVMAALSLAGCGDSTFSGPFSGDSGLNCELDPALCVLLGVAAVVAVGAIVRNNRGSGSLGEPTYEPTYP